ncbi:hypothetical protein GOHSU_03_00240 [Gordonia hirsuta DSM 44140 = NBRC 16056]|uniref:Uncharacterized protein n=1 Tax=Gordonia hirsuta DSM 44140 = NBRC 16056 TaxID=1121927 RepID=L7L4Q8_9ACTN|nr:hypothetical protein GOHSU_03_00240 [Gordonia hirsuta DSM 44140 = NBRC 16056]
MDANRPKEEDAMPNRISPDLASRVRGYSRRLTARFNLSAADRLSLQVAHTPVAVLGSQRRCA